METKHLTRTLKDDAFEDASMESVPCVKCGKPVELWFNGGELDRRECCGVIYRAEDKGYQIVCEVSHG